MIQYTSSNPSVLPVERGQYGQALLCLKPGTSRITVQSKDGHSFKYSWVVTVTDKFTDWVNPSFHDDANFRVE